MGSDSKCNEEDRDRETAKQEEYVTQKERAALRLKDLERRMIKGRIQIAGAVNSKKELTDSERKEKNGKNYSKKS